ncbi:hypothetical protein NAMH_1791 [Nautilia profundicola AmH]|uniref:Uncharacterized protein n=1 Tax=Nautilia profundicola (strain ATCC BAA-1463 / DSM 18972 / AmH) TaxID=598659 RepID=B9L719_NAUPA|nr:hypothetical protein [Nautilia profundicola]ACM92216.1 hypothetical protein NAMH_1791 [Nautilia profundicola AmH]
MRSFLLILSFIYLNAFEVEYTKVYTQYVVPKNEAIKIITKKEGLTFPFPFIKTKDGYILYGNIDQINMWLDNEFYAPDDAKFQTVKYTKVDFDKIQYRIINKTKHIYKSCKIKKIIFLTPDEDKIITKPTNITLKYKIELNCK